MVDSLFLLPLPVSSFPLSLKCHAEGCGIGVDGIIEAYAGGACCFQAINLTRNDRGWLLMGIAIEPTDPPPALGPISLLKEGQKVPSTMARSLAANSRRFAVTHRHK